MSTGTPNTNNSNQASVTTQLPYNVGNIKNPIINLRPSNPLPEEFAEMQRFGLRPYDRTPNDYLRFVANIFTAFRDPNDKFLNFDPFDDTYGAESGQSSDILQSTSDKHITAYIDGFRIEYQFTRLTTDANSTDKNQADNIIIDGAEIGPTGATELVTYINENGEEITIDQAKYGEYHRFIINEGVCFIDNQLIQIRQGTEWWFRVPEVQDIVDGKPTFAMGQFLTDQLKVYSLLPNKNYNIILSYQYITQYESNYAQIEFTTDLQSVDSPYLLLGTFSTNEYGMVHQTLPVNEHGIEKYKSYITKLYGTPGNETIRHFLRDINPQYLDKKYMANHKNLFKHLQSQLLTVLSDSKIANTFHAMEIKQDIDHSVSSGDFVYYSATDNRWYPAEVSRSGFDKVLGLYLKNVTEGTDFVFFGGIIEIDESWSIVNSDNMILKNLIPAQEYYLADDITASSEMQPFIDIIKIDDARDLGNSSRFNISTNIIAKADRVEFTITNNPKSDLQNFSLTKTFEIDSKLGEQRIPQTLNWDLTVQEFEKIPSLKNNTGTIATEKLSFDFKLFMVQSDIQETKQQIIDSFKLNDTKLVVPYTYYDNEKNQTQTKDIEITASSLNISINNLPEVLIGPRKPIINMLEAIGATADKRYPDFGIEVGDKFQNSGLEFSTLDTRNEIQTQKDKLELILYNTNITNLGLNDKLKILSDYLKKIENELQDLEESVQLQTEQMKVAKIEFQSTASIIQEEISTKRKDYLLVKNRYESIQSQIFNLEQKRIRLKLIIDDLISQRETLEQAKVDATDNIQNIDSLIYQTQTEVTGLQTEVNNLTQLIENDILYMETLLTDIKNLLIQIFNKYDYNNFKNHYYNISGAGIIQDMDVDNPANNEVLVRQRLLYIMNETLTQLEIHKSQEPIITYWENILEKKLIEYTEGVLGGTLTTAEQISKLDYITTVRTNLSEAQANYNSAKSKIIEYGNLRKNLEQEFIKSKNKPKAELFVTVQDSIDPTWTGTKLVTYTIKLDKAHTKKLKFKFAFREDTGETTIVELPAGQKEVSIGVYQNHWHDTYIENGVTKWIATDTGRFEFDPAGYQPVLNLNKFNEKLRNDAIYLGYDTNGANTYIYTLDRTLYVSNPLVSNYRGIVTEIMHLTSLENNILTGLNYFNTRESTEIAILENTLTLSTKTSSLNIKLNLLESLIQQKATGVKSIDIYDTQIIVINQRITEYTSSPNPIEIPNSTETMSLLNIDKDLQTIGSLKTLTASELQVVLVAYQEALDLLEEKTHESLGSYTTTIATINELIEHTKDKIITINTIHSIYEIKLEILINIYNNLNSILTSGLFIEAEESGIWSTLQEYLLKKFEYQEALQNILKDTFDNLNELGTVDNVLIPEILEFTTSIQGLSHPHDLSPWIFSKGSGKITTKSYPGATSVGIALNQNTLILNIQTNKRGDISEFLNVYGNGLDFIHQFERVYQSETSVTSKENKYGAIDAIDRKLSNSNQLLINESNHVTRPINGTQMTFNTTLTSTEMNALDFMNQTKDRRELLYRLIFMKYYGANSKIIKNYFDPSSYLFLSATTESGAQNESSSSYYSTGNSFLNTRIDILSDTVTTKTFIQRTTELMANAAGVDEVTLKNLFSYKVSLYKDKDILVYILGILEEPLINYNVRELEFEQEYTKIMQYLMDIERLNLGDDPNSVDPFEDPSLSIEEATRQGNALKKSGYYDNLIAIATSNLNQRYANLTTKENTQNTLIEGIVLFQRYRMFYRNLQDLIERTIEYYSNEKVLLQETKDKYNSQIDIDNSNFLNYYKQIDKLPNVMWDIFRITNFQRTKMNYTFLVLRIKAMQQELMNTIVNNNIQYSPTNSELNELKIKKNTALAGDKETEAFAYQTMIDALEIKRTQSLNLLQNYIDEFNAIQKTYTKPLVTKENFLTDDMIIDDLYMQDPDEYDFPYASYPFEKLPSGIGG